MRILINGWFHDQLGAGSGQYLAALAEWLPRVGGEHEFILVTRGRGDGEMGRWGDRETRGQGAHERSNESASQRNSESQREPFATRHSPFAISHSSYAIRTPFDRLNTNLAKLWFEQVAFPRACRRLRADVAFVPYWGSPWWSPCPVVVTVHDLIPLLLPQYRGGPLQRAYTWLVGRTARRAAAVLTDSAASKRDIVAHLGIGPERVHAIHLAADPRYRPVTDPAALADVRTKYNLPAGPFVLYLGGFDARKNVARVIEAYARIAARGQESGDRGQAGDRGEVARDG